MDIIFDGRSLALSSDGTKVAELKRFDNDLQYVTYHQKNITSTTASIKDPEAEIALIHDALVLGLRDYFRKSGFKRAILGLSGGLDSALVAALACEALGADNVLSILMPSVYSSDHSIKDALDLVTNTGCKHHIVP